MSSKGGDPERVSLGMGTESAPSLSLSGTRLAYSTETVSHNLVIRDLESGEETRLPNLRDGEMPTFSPDGNKIVFASKRWGTKLDLWCQSLGPGNSQGTLERLTDHPGHASHPKFSPDGKWIAYYRIIGEERDVWVIPASGGQPVKFTDHPSADIHPVWSSDGSMLAFVSRREEGAQIWMAPIKDGRRTGPPRRLSCEGLSAYAPVWSSDGARIAFLGIQENEQEAWLVPADGGAPPRQVTTGADVMRIRWDRSSGELFVSGTWGKSQYTLRRVSPAGGECVAVVPEVVFGPRMSSALFDVSKDGRLLVYSQEVLKGNIWVLETEEGVY